MNDKTHYRKAFNSPYLSSADIVEPTTLIIKHVKLEKDRTKKTKDSFNTAYFTTAEIRKGEPLKPMILNAHNSKIMRNFADSAFIEDWNNIPVSIYVDTNVRFGRDTVEGLRINPQPPKIERHVLEQGDKQWANAVAACKRDGNVDAVMERVDVSLETVALLEKEAGIHVA